MTTKADFLTSEWKQLLNAPHWVYLAIVEGEKGSFVTRRQEAKALDTFLDDYDASTRLIKYIVAEQKDAEGGKGSYADAKAALEAIGRLIDTKATEKEEAAIRGFLLDAGEAVAVAVIEKRKLIGDSDPISADEKKALSMIERALNAQSRSSLRGTSRSKRRAASSSSMADAIRKQVQQGPALPPTQSSKSDAQKSAVQQRAAKRRAAAEADEAQKEAVRQRAVERKARKDAEAKDRQAEEARQKAKTQAATEKRRKEVEDRRRAATERRNAAEAKKQADLEQKRKEAAARRNAVGERRSKPVQQGAPAPAKSPALQTYVVKPGDTLSHVSLHFYGTAHRWKDIFEANRNVLKNPNVIIPGQELVIPA